MDSGFQQHHFQDFPHQKQQSTGLTRFRSASTSYFSFFLDASSDSITSSDQRRDFSNARPLSPETETIFARFMASIDAENTNSSQKLCNIPENSAVQTDFAVKVKQESDIQQQPMMYHSQSKPPLANQRNSGVKSSMGIQSIPQMKTGFGGGINTNSSSSLARFNSSPAGFFSNLNIEGNLLFFLIMYYSHRIAKVDIFYFRSEEILWIIDRLNKKFMLMIEGATHVIYLKSFTLKLF